MYRSNTTPWTIESQTVRAPHGAARRLCVQHPFLGLQRAACRLVAAYVRPEHLERFNAMEAMGGGIAKASRFVSKSREQGVLAVKQAWNAGNLAVLSNFTRDAHIVGWDR